MIQGIKDLDKQVADATETRKEKQEDYVVELAANACLALSGKKVSMEKVINMVDDMVGGVARRGAGG